MGLDRLRRPLVAVLVLLTVVGVSATTWRVVVSGSSPATWAAGVVVFLSALSLLVVGLRRGWVMSLATVTGAVLLLAFWLKWVVAEPPLVYRHPVPYDSDGALRVSGVFAACFALTWWAISASPWGRWVRRTAGERASDDSAPGPREVWGVFAVGLVLLVVRVVLAEVWDVGVPGEVPKTIPIPLLLSGLYYLSTYAPLILAFYALHGASIRLRSTGAALLLGYAAVGVVVGERSYAISAALVVLYFYARKEVKPGEQRSLVRRLVVPGAIVLAAALSLWVTLLFRSTGSSGSGPHAVVTFVSDRIGGLNFLSPVLPVVQQTGPTLARLSGSNWDAFLLVNVYGFAPDAVNGVSGTLLGLAYASAGYVGIVVAALLTGTLTAGADRLLRSPTPTAAMWHLGALLAWLNLLLEGTVKPAVIMLVVYLATGYALGLLDRQRHTRTPPHERSRQRVDH